MDFLRVIEKRADIVITSTKILQLSLILMALLSLHLDTVMPLTYCYQGTYEIERADGYLMCDLCPDGTYMNKYDHRETACYACSKPDPDKKEIEYTPCNRTNDTTFICMEGYYRDLPRNPRETGRCVKCTDCEAQGLYPGRACQTFSDSICCAHEMFDVAENGDGHPMCRERPRMCGPGQYYSHDSYECIPCPSGTYMDLKYHSAIECWKCHSMAAFYVPPHTVIDQECNSTHPATYRCKDRYYRNDHMGHTDDATGCAPCTVCKNLKDKPYVGLNCTPETDTVCCPQQDMVVEGRQCKDPRDFVADAPVPTIEDSNEFHTDPPTKVKSPRIPETTDQNELCTDPNTNKETLTNGTNHVHTDCCTCCEDMIVWRIVAITLSVSYAIVILLCVAWKYLKKRDDSRKKLNTCPPEQNPMMNDESRV